MLLLVLLSFVGCSVCAHELVAPGTLASRGGGGGGGGGGGWGVVDEWPIGFFIAGSSLAGVNGLYVRPPSGEPMDAPALPHRCGMRWANVDAPGWSVLGDVHGRDDGGGHAVVGSKGVEWLLVDERGRDRFGSEGGFYLPSAGDDWEHLHRPFAALRAGDRVAARLADGGAGDGEVLEVLRGGAAVRWRRDGAEGSGEVCAARELRLERASPPGPDEGGAADDAEQLPWQVVAIMSRAKMEELLADKRRHDAQVRQALLGGAGAGRAAGLLAGTGGASEGEEGAVCDALLAPARDLLASGQAAAAVAALELVLVADRGCPMLEKWLVRAHARAMHAAHDAGACAPVHEGVCAGDEVRFPADVPGFWSAGDGATVIGLGTPGAPIALRTHSGKLVDTQPSHFSPPRPKLLPGAAAADHYTVLGLGHDFTPKELKKAWRVASLKLHPDKGGDPKAFDRAAAAHAVLSDDAARAEYDSAADLPQRQATFSLADEVRRRYFPERRGFQAFGDPHERRKQRAARDRERRRAEQEAAKEAAARRAERIEAAGHDEL